LKGDIHVNNSLAWWPTVLVLGIACFTDIRSRRIPNWLVVPFGLSGLIVNSISKGLAGLGNSALGIGLAILVCGIFCYLRGMGMGDLKLYAAIGAWVGPRQLEVALVVTFVAGAAIGIIWALSKGSLSKSLDSTGELVAGFGRRGIRPHETIVLENAGALKIPYAPAIAIGTLFSFFAV
jgi:prepilin peptidase CpaA